MSDVIVTLPKSFGLEAWIAEGDPAGTRWSGEEWHFYLGGPRPKMASGDRVYVCFDGQLIGYAPLVRIESTGAGFALVRHGDAVAVTIDEHIPGFRGWRYRWWHVAEERPFPEWDRGIVARSAQRTMGAG
jgi:hypothetical protein